MEVRFHRTAERRYAVTIHCDEAPTVEMDPAPGYDPIMPHDLLHLVVESELGLRRGIFGQVASGGHAGTFHRAEVAGASRRELARRRRRAARRGDRLLREGRDEAAQSERATFVCLVSWLARSEDRDRRRIARGMSSQAQHIQDTQGPAERRAVTVAIAGICARLDELSARWQALLIGQSLSVEWPYRS